MFGAVGGDENGSVLLARLAAQGVDVGRVRRIEGAASGLAMVAVSEDGENQIVVASGANALVDGGYVVSVRTQIADADVLILQGEIPREAALAAIEAAGGAGRRVVVNLAPVLDLGDALGVADPLVVNEVEAGQLLGADLATPAGVRAAADKLRSRARTCVVTMGARGAVLVERERVIEIEAPNVLDVRDTTGAGDALVGVLAAALAQGRDLEYAVRCAVAAAGRSVTVEGAGEQYPDFALEGLGARQGEVAAA
jgi:ribokinase